MSISTKRFAAVAAASALGLSGAFVAADASAQTPTPTPTPTVATPKADPSTPAATPKAAPAAQLLGPGAKGNPTYSINSNTGVSTTHGVLVDSKGAPIAGGTVTVYNFTGDKRGAQFGQSTSDANGAFTISAAIPANVRSGKYNLELAYAGNDANGPVSRLLNNLDGVTPTPTATTKPTTKPTTPGKPGLPSTGAEGMPVLPALASLGVLAAGAAVVLRRK